MSTLSVAELQAQVETDLSDTDLQQIIDAVERDIRGHVGPTTGYVHEYDGLDMATMLRLPVAAASITTVVEYTDAVSDPTETTLSSDDYELSDDAWWLRRLSSGTNPRSLWGWHVIVTFEPEADAARRKQAAIQLARLEVVHTGYSREASGDWSASSADNARERARILRNLEEVAIS